MDFLFAVIGVVLVVEGIPWFLSPAGVKSLLRHVTATPDNVLRVLGLTSMLLGLLTVYLVVG